MSDYKARITHYEGEGDPYWQFVESDVTTVTGQVFAANVEKLTDFDGNLVGFTIYETYLPRHDFAGRVEVPGITSDRTFPSPIIDEVAALAAKYVAMSDTAIGNLAGGLQASGHPVENALPGSLAREFCADVRHMAAALEAALNPGAIR